MDDFEEKFQKFILYGSLIRDNNKGNNIDYEQILSSNTALGVKRPLNQSINYDDNNNTKKKYRASRELFTDTNFFAYFTIYWKDHLDIFGKDKEDIYYNIMYIFRCVNLCFDSSTSRKYINYLNKFRLVHKNIDDIQKLINCLSKNYNPECRYNINSNIFNNGLKMIPNEHTDFTIDSYNILHKIFFRKYQNKNINTHKFHRVVDYYIIFIRKIIHAGSTLRHVITDDNEFITDYVQIFIDRISMLVDYNNLVYNIQSIKIDKKYYPQQSIIHIASTTDTSIISRDFAPQNNKLIRKSLMLYYNIYQCKKKQSIKCSELIKIDLLKISKSAQFEFIINKTLDDDINMDWQYNLLNVKKFDF